MYLIGFLLISNREFVSDLNDSVESYSYSNSHESFEINNNQNDRSSSPNTFKTLHTALSQADFKSTDDIEQVNIFVWHIK